MPPSKTPRRGANRRARRAKIPAGARDFERLLERAFKNVQARQRKTVTAQKKSPARR